jgi:hypothetical protein
MTVSEFEQFLKKKKPTKMFLMKHIERFEKFLQKECGKKSVDEATAEDLLDFVKYQLKRDKIPRMQGLAEYAIYRDDSALYKGVKEAHELYKTRPWWVDNLSEALDERVGKSKRKEILKGREGLKQTSSAAKKIAFSREVIDRMEWLMDEEVCKETLSCGLHKRSRNSLEKLRKDFVKSGSLDEFLESKQRESLEKWASKGQYLKTFVEENPDVEFGVRKGDVIIVSKVPHQARQYIEAENLEKKKFHYCHCGWAKESLRREGTEISPMFCYCGAGWYRQVWEVVFGQTVTVDVIESVLEGDMVCRFAVHIPPDIMEAYVQGS